MTLEEYKNILITGTPSDRARAIVEAGNDRSLTDEEFHELTAMIKGVVRPGRRKMTPDEAKLWAEVSRINTRLKDEMVNAGFAVRALPGDLQEDAINVLSRTVSGMLGDLTAMMAIDRAATLEWRGYATACAQVLGFGPRRLEKLRQETIANFGQLNEWVEQDGVDVAMEMLCRCARDAYKTEVEVLDVPDEAVLEKQRRETAETIRQLQVQAVQREVSRKRVPCVLPLSEAEVQRRVEAVTSSLHSSPEMSTVLSRRRI